MQFANSAARVGARWSHPACVGWTSASRLCVSARAFLLGAPGLETGGPRSRAFAGSPCGGLRGLYLRVEWLPFGLGSSSLVGGCFS